MNVTLTINADSPEELHRAIRNFFYSQTDDATKPMAPAPKPNLDPDDAAVKPKRGRPAKSAEPVEAPEFAEQLAAEPQTAAPKPAAAPAGAAIEKKDVQKLLIAVVQKHGVAACSEICMKHGGPNLSALDPSTYPSVVADAQAKLAVEAAA
jgi:hypothetical protein